MDKLTCFILGLQTAWLEDPGCTPVEMVYGTNLHIPGEFWPSANNPMEESSSEFLHYLQAMMR